MNGKVGMEYLNVVQNVKGMIGMKTVKSGTKNWIRYHGVHHAGYVRQMRSVHFGLGSAESYDSVEVIWPAGKSTLLPGGRTNQTITVRYDGE